MATVTLYVSYAAPGGEAPELRVDVPATKTVRSVAKAVAKLVERKHGAAPAGLRLLYAASGDAVDVDATAAAAFATETRLSAAVDAAPPPAPVSAAVDAAPPPAPKASKPRPSKAPPPPSPRLDGLCVVAANQGLIVRAGRSLETALVGEVAFGAVVRVSGHVAGDGRCAVAGGDLEGFGSSKCLAPLVDENDPLCVAFEHALAEPDGPQASVWVRHGGAEARADAVVAAARAAGPAAWAALARATRQAAAAGAKPVRDDARRLLPVQPVAFKDFSLYVPHLKKSSKGMLKANSHGTLQGVFMLLAKCARLPVFQSPYAAVEAKPAYYQSNHMTFVVGGDAARVEWPALSAKLDYELEVAAVMGRGVHNATEQEALDAVAGFVVINDISLRDVQWVEMAEIGLGINKAKGFATGMSPVLVTADEVLPRLECAPGLAATVAIGGRVVASGTTARPDHSLGTAIAYASMGESIAAGEILGMGTVPSCTALENDEWLKPGQTISLKVEGIGQCTHTILPRATPHVDFKSLSMSGRGANRASSGGGCLRLLALLVVLVAAAFGALSSPAVVAMLERRSSVKPLGWTEQPPLPELTGPLAPNGRLASATRVLEGHQLLVGPESFADGPGGEVYTGVAGGFVLSVPPSGGEPTPVFFTPAALDGASVAASAHSMAADCAARASAGEREAEERCGRPLGLRTRGNTLYVADAYFGIFRVNLTDNHSEHLVGPQDVFPSARFFNDLDLAPDGTIYFTDTSPVHPRRRNRQEVVEGRGRGRLFRLTPGQAKPEVIADGLFFANGVQLEPTGRGVLVAETTRLRVTRCPLPVAPGKRCALEPFAVALPGTPDNLRLAQDGEGYWVALGFKSAAPFSVLQWMLANPLVGVALGNFLSAAQISAAIEKHVPVYGLAVRLGLDGTVHRSAHDTTKHMHTLSEVHEQPDGTTWLGSHSNRFLGRLAEPL